MFVTANRVPDAPSWIINFLTKRHWRKPSRFDWIAEGCEQRRGLPSITGAPEACGGMVRGSHHGKTWAITANLTH